MRTWVAFRPAIGLTVVAGLAFTAGNASSAVIVLGAGFATECSEAAEAGSTRVGDVQACDRSIATEELDPRSRAATHINRGIILMRRGDRVRALSDFNTAIGIGEYAGEAYVNRGALNIVEDRAEEGLADTDRALALPLREPARAWFNRGVAHEELGNVQAAYGDYRRAAELSPGWNEPVAELARFTVRRR